MSGGRAGLSPATSTQWGTLRLTTVGRRSGRERSVLVGYFEDGPNVVTLAMNGWGAPEPAWWLNLQAQPDVLAELSDGPRLVHARIAVDPERSRLWAKWRTYNAKLDSYATRRPSETAVVVLEPRT